MTKHTGSHVARGTQVYHLPLFDTEWRLLLDDIFGQMGLRPCQVVRCLLAAMPAGAAIPPHHDNGKWVANTHRVHLPIITNKDLAFWAGPTLAEMRRYAVCRANARTVHRGSQPLGWAG
jgi:hypothetical protein